MPTNRPCVGIVGGGASGILVAAQLLRQATEPIEILLFDPASELGGLAYLHAGPEHLLNVPAARMSAIASQPNHFLDWLNKRAQRSGAPDVKPLDFAPRRTYGEYLRATLEDAFRCAAQGSVLRHVPSRVVQFLPEGRSGVAIEQNGERHNLHFLVLALGNLPSRDPLHSNHSFSAIPAT